MQAIKDWTEQILDDHAPSTLICVGINEHLATSIESVESWCLDHSFEYVSMKSDADKSKEEEEEKSNLGGKMS